MPSVYETILWYFILPWILGPSAVAAFNQSLGQKISSQESFCSLLRTNALQSDATDLQATSFRFPTSTSFSCFLHHDIITTLPMIGPKNGSHFENITAINFTSHPPYTSIGSSTIPESHSWVNSTTPYSNTTTPSPTFQLGLNFSGMILSYYILPFLHEDRHHT